ncbi:MAG TPA: efflux RND transporter periplasmic adaptor subunit [Gemmatimonadaceae bacterium]|nr:efflux RND transporter periplasmic adaptor subunit [Gemmatimonadaceae bacterium]
MHRSLALLSVALLAACGGGDDTATPAASDSPAAATPAGTVVLGSQDLAVAEMSTIGSGLTISGNLDPADVVQVRAQVPGTVAGVRVDRGSSVRAGAVLAIIEAQGIRSQAAGAQAQVSAAQAQLSIAQQRLDASKRLFDAGAISEIDYKQAQANVQVAQANLAGARAAAAGAGESAGRATITAPISGVVSARMVSGGEAVSPGAPLFTVVNASELELAGRVGVADAARVRVGQPVTFTLDAYPNQVYRGRVARMDPTADPGTRQVGVYVRLANPNNRIVGGQFARGTIETGSSLSAVVIPEVALANRTGNAATVFVLNGNRVSRRSVTVGERDAASGRIAVLNGLQAGERVLLNPTSDITDGTQVSVTSDAPPAPPAVARDTSR